MFKRPVKLNKRHNSLKSINFSELMHNSTLITVNFCEYYIIHECHFLMEINK